MLVYIDESGDTGLKTYNGSSLYFVVSLVLFENNEEAIVCDQRIELLKKELRFNKNKEFKFNKLKREERIAFIHSVLPYSFFYFRIVIDKDPKKLYGDGFKVKESFYKYACSLVVENAKSYLHEAIVVIDGSGSREFKKQLQFYLKRKTGMGIIKKVKIQNSCNNNLIQLTDIIAGSIHRSFSNKGDKEVYRRLLGTKEMRVQKWPK